MSVQSELDRVTAAREAIHTAIENKGVTVPAGTVLADMPNYVAQISTSHAFSEITGRYDTLLTFGGPALKNDVSPVGMALSSEHSANRAAYFPGDRITMEYSSDAGETWTDYGLSDNDKSALFTTDYQLNIGKNNSTDNITLNSMTRITMTCQNGTSAKLYTSLRKILINMGTPSTLSLSVQVRTGTDYLAGNDNWIEKATASVSGDSGWNDIPAYFVVGGNVGTPSQYWQVRFVFRVTQIYAAYPNVCKVVSIRMFGATYWGTPSNLARYGHLYSYDINQTAIFPTNVTASNGYINAATLYEGWTSLANKYQSKLSTTNKLSANCVDGVLTPTYYTSGQVMFVNNGGSNSALILYSQDANYNFINLSGADGSGGYTYFGAIGMNSGGEIIGYDTTNGVMSYQKKLYRHHIRLAYLDNMPEVYFDLYTTSATAYTFSTLTTYMASYATEICVTGQYNYYRYNPYKINLENSVNIRVHYYYWYEDDEGQHGSYGSALIPSTGGSSISLTDTVTAVS